MMPQGETWQSREGEQRNEAGSGRCQGYGEGQVGAGSESCPDTPASVKYQGSPAAPGTPRTTTGTLADHALASPDRTLLLRDSTGPPSSVTLCLASAAFPAAPRPTARVTPSHCLSPWPAPAFHSHPPPSCHLLCSFHLLSDTVLLPGPRP